MDKTIENIKKFLHIGGVSKGKKGDKLENGSPEKATLYHQTITTNVELNKEEIIKR